MEGRWKVNGSAVPCSHPSRRPCFGPAEAYGYHSSAVYHLVAASAVFSLLSLLKPESSLRNTQPRPSPSPTTRNLHCRASRLYPIPPRQPIPRQLATLDLPRPSPLPHTRSISRTNPLRRAETSTPPAYCRGDGTEYPSLLLVVALLGRSWSPSKTAGVELQLPTSRCGSRALRIIHCSEAKRSPGSVPSALSASRTHVGATLLPVYTGAEILPVPADETSRLQHGTSSHLVVTKGRPSVEPSPRDNWPDQDQFVSHTNEGCHLPSESWFLFEYDWQLAISLLQEA